MNTNNRRRNLELLKTQIRHFVKKIQPVYELLDWKWGTKNGKEVPPYIPLNGDLKDILCQYIDEMIKDDTIVGQKSGGIEVWYLVANEKENRMEDECYMRMNISCYSWEAEPDRII